MTDRNGLILSIREALWASYDKWGEVKTPFGKIWVAGHSIGWTSADGRANMVIDRGYANAHNGNGQVSTDDLLYLADEKIPAIANYLASSDFIQKVEGSISTLKKITKAIQ